MRSADETRPVISVDLGRMNRLIAVDDDSGLARIQAGALGPDIEEQLEPLGWTLGHFPDSFTHSTLGGWVATRSSGMQSDKYGDIADIARGLRVVMPGKVLVLRPLPSTSTGPSVREMILGSEGRLGIITEVTVQVHRIPEKRQILGYLFPTWDAGLAAMQEISDSDARPTHHPGLRRARDSILLRHPEEVVQAVDQLTGQQGFDEGAGAPWLAARSVLPVVHRLRGEQVARVP